MADNKLERLRLLIDSLVMQAQMETDPKRKAKLVESAEICTKRLEQEKGKVTTHEQK
jgi:hypothetical protein